MQAHANLIPGRARVVLVWVGAADARGFTMYLTNRKGGCLDAHGEHAITFRIGGHPLRVGHCRPGLSAC